jgi:hypothetical protein
MLLAGAGLAGTALLAACGSSKKTDTPVMSLEPNDTSAKASQLQAIFDFQNPYLITGSPQRLTFGVLGPDGSYSASVPDTLSFQITKDGTATTPVNTVSSHTDGVPIGYFPLITTFDTAGNYQAVTTIDGKQSTQAFSVFDPSATKLVPIGRRWCRSRPRRWPTARASPRSAPDRRAPARSTRRRSPRRWPPQAHRC